GGAAVVELAPFGKGEVVVLPGAGEIAERGGHVAGDHERLRNRVADGAAGAGDVEGLQGEAACGIRVALLQANLGEAEERILDAVRIAGAAEIERGGVTGGGGGEIAAGRGHVAEIDQGGRNVQLVIAGGEVLACLLELAGGGGEMALVLFENG